MRTIDLQGNELKSPNLEEGRLTKEKLFVKRHEAVKAVKEKWHYEVVAEYPNGGKDVEKVIDVPCVKAAEAWDEYEEVMRYIPYTEEELAEQKAKMGNKKNPFEERLNKIEKCLEILMASCGVSMDE